MLAGIPEWLVFHRDRNLPCSS